MNLYLARHGQNGDNANGILNGHRDLPLTAIGIAQAEEVAAKILGIPLHFDHVFTSPLHRAIQTAEIIARITHSASPVVMPNLIERDFGVMTGIEQSRITELCSPEILQAEKVTYFLSPEGAETFPELVTRARTLLAELQEMDIDGTILLVTHGDFGKMIYAAYYNLDWKDVLVKFHFGNSELLFLSQDSDPGDTHVFRIVQHNT